MRAIITLLFLMFTASLAGAEPAAFDFGGERFVKKFDAGKAPNRRSSSALPTSASMPGPGW
jgi:hypothetical protein